MVNVIATIKIQPAAREKFLEHFLALVPTVLAEEGCVEYFPTVDAETDIDVQARDAHAVTIIEKWESVEALQAHLAAEHMERFRQNVADMITDLSVKVLTPVT